MSARPGNWSLVSDDGGDPVSGDPDAVLHEANYYANMAETILEEAHRLSTLGQDDELVGKYKKSLQEELGDLADEVHKAHKRYDGVGTALKPYSTALYDAKSESWGALQDAETAHTAQTNANNLPNPQATDGKPLTTAQKTSQSNRTTAIGNANDALTKARTRLHNALTDLNNAGKKAADSINDHNDDSLKDHHHWWDVVVKIIKVLVEIANYVVIVLAIVALFIPGLDLIVIAISLAILAADTLLAATGNGSWMDVLVDLVAVCTLGAGRGLAKAGERGAETAIEGATKAAIKTEFKNSGNIFMRNVFGRGGKMLRATETGTTKVDNFVTAFRETVDTKVSGMDALMSGGRELAEPSKLVAGLDREFGGVSGLTKAYLSGLRTVNRPVWATGVTLPLGNVAFSKSNLPGIIGDKPYSETWEHGKESLSYHTPISASEYNWNDHPAVASAVSGAVYGPEGMLLGLGG